ncbi:acyl carrier protein [Myxococcota bacterium]|nr:acyl carrier protein [Myxococcota bacterium]
MNDAETAPGPQMTDEALLALIGEIAQTRLGYAGTLTPDTRLVEALALDSVRLLTLVVELENRLELCLDEGDEQGVETVGELISLLRRRHAAG